MDYDKQQNWYFWDEEGNKNIPMEMSLDEEFQDPISTNLPMTMMFESMCNNTENGTLEKDFKDATLFRYDVETHCMNFRYIVEKPETYGEPYRIHAIYSIDT